MTGIFQSPEWEQFKLSTGYQASFRIDDILILQKKLPLGRSMLYSPMVDQDKILKITDQNFCSELQHLAQKTKAIFYRAELDIPLGEAESCKLIPGSYKKAFEEMQPEHTLKLDLTLSEAEILSQMKQKGRYNIKIAQKNNIHVEEENDINNFYSLYSTMAQRQKITFRSKNYYQKLFDIMGANGYVKVLTGFAREEQNKDKESNNIGVPIASAIVSLYGKQAIYLFGGSSDQYRNLMAPYLVQWAAIKEAKQAKCKSYDFFGIAPSDDPRHPWHGVTRFKKQFGGEQIDIAGSYDLVFRPVDYQLFKAAEKIRR